MTDRMKDNNRRVQQNCCARCHPLKALYIGILYLIALLALIFGVWAWSNSSFPYAWTAITVSGPFSTGSATSLVTATTPVTLTMPSILTSWIGMVFHIECISPLAHTVRIPGPYTWDGTNNRATCNASVPGTPTGFTFLITGPFSVRILDSSQMLFSLVI